MKCELCYKPRCFLQNLRGKLICSQCLSSMLSDKPSLFFFLPDSKRGAFYFAGWNNYQNMKGGTR